MPLALVFYSFLFFSPEVAVNLGGINLPTYRVALLLLTLPAAVMLLGRTGGGPNFIDVVVVIMSFWIMLSFSLNYGLEDGLVRGGGVIIDTGLSYLVARASISSLNHVRYLLIVLLPGLMVAGLFLALESLSGQLLLRPAFASVFGSVSSFVTDGGSSAQLVTERRLGFVRAYGPFAHPILAGAFMVSFLPLYYFSGLRSWPFFAGIAVALTGFFSLSSGTFLCLLIAIFAFAIDYVKQMFPKLTWWVISSLLILNFWAVHIVSQNGIISIISRFTLTPHTAGYRILIWEYGWRTIQNYPWFGIGYKSWERLDWMHDSVDAHFLLLGMRYGVIVPILLTSAIVYGVIRLGLLAPRLGIADRNLAIGINITIIILFVVGQTVAFFGSGVIAFMAFLAILASVLSYLQSKVERESGLPELSCIRTARDRSNPDLIPICPRSPA